MILEISIISMFVSIPAIQEGWSFVVENTSEFQLTVWGLFFGLVFGYFLGCMPYIIMNTVKIPFIEKYKVQVDKYASPKDMIKCTLSLLALFTLIMLPMIALGYPVFKIVGVHRSTILPPWYAVALQLVVFFLVEDYLNYWIHRALHTPWLYKHIHAVHHEFSSPFALAATYAHPLEVLILGIPTFMGPVIIGPHLVTLIIWLFLRQYEAIDIHSGYEFPWSINGYLPFYAGTEHHDYHHYMYSGNFASVFTWCDKIYGSGLGYDHYKEKKRKYE